MMIYWNYLDKEKEYTYIRKGINMEEIKAQIINLKAEKRKLLNRLKEIEKIEKLILISLLDSKTAKEILEELKESEKDK